jgi:hypothetical protein
MDLFENRIDGLITDMVLAGLKPETIMWKVGSSVIKKCDAQYRIDQPLRATRQSEPIDKSNGDSIHDSSVTKLILDRELNQYMNHTSDCICYTGDNDCPICVDSFTEYQIQCCKQFYHQKCLKHWYQEKYDNPRCPTCRHKLILDANGHVALKLIKPHLINVSNNNISDTNNNNNLTINNNNPIDLQHRNLRSINHYNADNTP